MELHERIKKARTDLHLSQEYVANYLGVKRTAIVEIESGKRSVKAEELRQFSRLFRISADLLLEGDETPLSDDELLRGFTELDDADRQEILNLIKFKKMMKNKKGQ
jgi:transcriptional regulator with XRE-family HTH domain